MSLQREADGRVVSFGHWGEARQSFWKMGGSKARLPARWAGSKDSGRGSQESPEEGQGHTSTAWRDGAGIQQAGALPVSTVTPCGHASS